MTRMGVPFPLSKRARPCAGGWVDHCPAHDDREPSLSIRVASDGRLLLYCHAGCRFEDILSAAGISGRQSPRVSPAIQREIAARDSADRQARVLRAQAIWQQGLPIEGSLAETYLGSRGITLWGEDQRFQPALWYSQGGAYRPALVSPIIRDNLRVGVHRVFLDDSGRKLGRTMLGDCRGGAVRLGGTGGRLVVAEGVETTLALRQLTPDQPGEFWAALSTGNMAILGLPPEPGELVVGADGEQAGRDAAQALCARAARLGWQATMISAPDGKDFNDVLMEQMRHAD
ncbi:MAG: toprim domain-containing protein [Rhodobacteraceae bacterium]|nr:toprim domain-containing protein [Paracoccaceae bacterium]